MTAAEIRAAINFGKETIEYYHQQEKVVPRFVYERIIELYEELVETLSTGKEA